MVKEEKFYLAKICVMSGIKGAASKVDGIGTVLHGGTERLHGAGGSQQFEHKNPSFSWYIERKAMIA